jgi:hypothetical protein
VRFNRYGLYWACPKYPRVSSTVACRLVLVVSFLHTFTMASWVQLPSAPAGAQRAALPTLAPLVKKVSAGIVNIPKTHCTNDANDQDPDQS